MLGEIPPEKVKGLQGIIREATEEIKEEERKEPAEPLVQKFPFDPASESERKIEKLRRENADLKKTIEELKGPLLERIEKMEKEIENLKKTGRGGRYA